MAQDSSAAAPAKIATIVSESTGIENTLRGEASFRSVGTWLVIAAFTVRIVFMLVLGTYRFDRHDDQSDVNEDTYIARSLTAGHGFSSPFSTIDTGPTAWVTPIYPYFVAAVFKYCGAMSHRSYLVIQTVQSLFSALTVIPLIGIGVLTGCRRGGIAAASLWAFFPWFSRWALTWIWETSLSALLLAALIWFALWLRDNGKPRAWAGFGALWGLALLVNPALSSLLPITLGIALYGQWRERSRWIRPFITFAAACLIVVSPWLVRNRVVMGQWVFLRDNFGFEFALGNYHLSFGRGWAGKHPSVNPREFDRYRQLGELGYIQANTSEALRFVREYPGEFLSITAKRVLYFWDGSGMEYRGPVAPCWFPWSFALFSFLLLPALLICRRLKVQAFLILFLVVLIYPIPYYLTHPPVRYRHIIEPEIVLLLSLAAVEGWARLRKQHPARLSGQAA